MKIGVCKVRLHFPENQSLKDKRRIIKSITTRVKNNYNVSIAEVEDQDLWQLATLGIACLSNSNQQTTEVLSKVVDFISHTRFGIEILDCEMEIIPF
jgi:hypothetical protein